MDGMTGVYWDDKGQEVTVTADNQDNWYDYENQKWANATTKDGSYWVWIPRYAYKIESGCYTNTAGTIAVKFLKETSNKDASNTEIKTTYPTVSSTGAMQDYVVHPSFTNGKANNYMNGEWRDNIAGYWVAKYAAGFQASTTDASDATKVVNGNDTIVYSNEKYTTYNTNYGTNAISQDLSKLPEMSYPVFKPLTYAYNNISIGDSYTLSKRIATASSFYGLNSSKTDSHLIKNSEWGAVAYLAQSSCGRNGTEVSMNSKNVNNSTKNIYALTGYSGETAKGVDASTTNNMSGVFDMRGCVWERTSAYITNGADNLKYGSSFVAVTTENKEAYKTLSTEYATVYPHDSTNLGTTYNTKKSLTYGFGDAILETSARTTTTDGWNEDFSYYPYYAIPFFERGGHCDGTAANTGSFAFDPTGGVAHMNFGFRSILIAL